MNHQIGRGQIFSALARGGTAYITARPDLSELFNDIRIVRPTELSILPRVMEMIHRHFVGEVIQRSVGRDDEDIRAEVMRSEEHTSELHSLMRSSYAVFCLNKKNSH